MLGTEFDWLSIGAEVLNLVPKLVAWRVCETWRGRTERTNLTSHMSSAVINLSLLLLVHCVPSKGVWWCLVWSLVLLWGTYSRKAKWPDGYRLGFRNPKSRCIYLASATFWLRKVRHAVPQFPHFQHTDIKCVHLMM